MLKLNSASRRALIVYIVLILYIISQMLKKKRICEQCGGEISGRGIRFCTLRCKGKWQSKHRRGKNSPHWKGGKIIRVCKECGVEFPIEPANIKWGRGKFCSPKCHGKWKSKHLAGENSSRWNNGASFEPYCQKFNRSFKEYIREKFGRICFLCGKTEPENGRKLDVHHVNGNKNCGCDGDKTCQFVPVCRSCHSKMNSEKVDWEAKIKTEMRNKLNGWYI